jgi:hypothetical protein
MERHSGHRPRAQRGKARGGVAAVELHPIVSAEFVITDATGPQESNDARLREVLRLACRANDPDRADDLTLLISDVESTIG